jgi:NTP pyrophosphatase (non-canonical NTP hydrolase)
MSLHYGKTEVHFNGKHLGTMADVVAEAKELTVTKQASMVNALAKPGQQLVDEMTPLKAHLNHMIIGLGGEVGEVMDCVKKFTMYNKELDKENLKEEIGDLLFYMVGILNSVDINIYECMSHNQAKLAERYKSKTYSDQAAIERADKKGE